MTVQRVLNPGFAGEVACSLERLSSAGGSSVLARCLELLADSFVDRPPLEDLIDFVITGPVGTGASGRDTSVVVRELFQNATFTVAVLGYAVHQGQIVFEALADRMLEIPDLQVRLYLDIQREFGNTSAASELVSRFAQRFRDFQWPKGRPLPHVYYIRNHWSSISATEVLFMQNA
jgi:hypothetical protein